jgi:predicted nucleotidyltransferase
MNNPKFKLIGFSITLALAGLAVLFNDSIPFAVILLMLAVLIFLSVIIFFFWEKLPSIITDIDKPKAKAKEIYQEAAIKGGTIHATHIFPNDRNPKNDFAVETLSKTSEIIDLSFNRILLLDSLEDERYWLENLFSSLPQNISKKFYLLNSYPLILPRIAKALLPRLNLLLYQNVTGRVCNSFIGLDHLHLAGVNVNFAIHSRSRNVYRTLLKYFEQIAGSGHFRPCNSIEEYNATQRASSQIERGQGVVARIVDFAEITPGVMFVGLFGSMARVALGISSNNMMEQADLDVDLVVIYDKHSLAVSISDLRQHIENMLNPQRTSVTWGPDLTPFYEFRTEGKINVDIELLEVGSDFYKKNQLLGYSIFRYFMPLYSIDRLPVVNYLDIPTSPLSLVERRRLLLKDRQGLEFFSDKLNSSLKSTDPRRLCTHVLRNTVWAISGEWPLHTKEAINYLQNDNILGKCIEVQTAKEILSSSEQDIKRKLDSYYEQLVIFIQPIIEKLRNEFAKKTG